MSDRPRYADLPDGCAWDLHHDAFGSLSLLTPERVAAAAALVRTGRRFSLDLPVDEPNPPFFGRQPVQHEVFELLDHVLDDRLDNYYPQGSTQWDGFGHYAHSTRGFHGGHDKDAVRAGAVGIEAWHGQGIVGRGVLLDAGRRFDIDGGSSFVVTPAMLDEVAAAQGVALGIGDIVCVRVAWMSWYRALDPDARAALAEQSHTFQGLAIPGLGPGPALAEWCWDHGVAALAVDNPTVEPFPPSVGWGEGGVTAPFTPDDMAHVRVMTMLGIPFGEFFDLDALADDCATDGVYEFLFTSAPLGIPGGIGSPPNALAMK
jgi:kynurenine formamidase